MRMGRAGHGMPTKETRNAWKIRVGKHEGKKPLGRCRLRWEDNIKLDLKFGWRV
jgi:hypothetical protein